VLEKQGKAQLIDMGAGEYSVKFIWSVSIESEHISTGANNIILVWFIGEVEDCQEELHKWQRLVLCILRVAVLNIQLFAILTAARSLRNVLKFGNSFFDFADRLVSLLSIYFANPFTKSIILRIIMLNSTIVHLRTTLLSLITSRWATFPGIYWICRQSP
jgi:hypothetical protein